jgi:hypothetical protein
MRQWQGDLRHSRAGGDPSGLIRIDLMDPRLRGDDGVMVARTRLPVLKSSRFDHFAVLGV